MKPIKAVFAVIMAWAGVVHSYSLQDQTAVKQLVVTAKSNQAYKPVNGYVPNEKTAINIAVSVWEPIFGKEKIDAQAPYRAALVEGLWVVVGTLPEGYIGGTAIAVIAKDSGQILHVEHGQ
jgi:hypothetical protein